MEMAPFRAVVVLVESNFPEAMVLYIQVWVVNKSIY